jgi:signal transduction histidine kinase
VAFALGAEWLRVVGHWSPLLVLADLLPGLAFLAAGQLAWARRPGNRIGPLLVLTGFAWYIGSYRAAPDPTISGLAYAFQGYYDGLIAWLVLAYPSGRLRWRSSRLVVAAFLLTLVARTVIRSALYHPVASYGDLSDPAVALRYVADVSLRNDVDFVFRVAIVCIAFGVLILVVARFRSASPAGRQIAGPILLGGLAVALGIIAEFWSGFVPTATGPDRFALADVGDYLTAVTATVVPLAFLVGLVRGRLSRGSVADLVVQLGEAPQAPRLRDILSRALGDPTLEVAYAVSGTSTFVDAAGHPIELPPTDSHDRAVTRMERDGQPIAALIHDPAIVERQELVTSVAAAAGLALENERLQAAVRMQLEDVRASRARIVEAGDAERRRVERDLHDGAQQQLVTLALALQVARTRAATADPSLVAMLDRASAQLEAALAELRELARGLHPSILVEEGLAAAIESLAERTPLPVELHLVEERFPAQVEATAYFVVAEALANVVKYASATQVRITVDRRNGVLAVEAADDGRGGADPAKGSGLRGLDDRVAAVGGRFSVTSPPLGGTTIRVEIPCG